MDIAPGMRTLYIHVSDPDTGCAISTAKRFLDAAAASMREFKSTLRVSTEVAFAAKDTSSVASGATEVHFIGGCPCSYSSRANHSTIPSALCTEIQHRPHAGPRKQRNALHRCARDPSHRTRSPRHAAEPCAPHRAGQTLRWPPLDASTSSLRQSPSAVQMHWHGGHCAAIPRFQHTPGAELR